MKRQRQTMMMIDRYFPSYNWRLGWLSAQGGISPRSSAIGVVRIQGVETGNLLHGRKWEKFAL
jgi:hypothetical protein